MSWKAEYAIIIIGSTIVDYWAGLRMGRDISRKRKRKYLLLSLASNLGILFFFKYFNFVNDSAQAVLNQFSIFYDKPELNVLLPVGISFYTFQTLSYSIEVYTGKQKPEKHFGIFALYVSFFPQLVAGPIERFVRLGRQFKIKHKLKWENISNGLRLILFGLFIKMVIADNLAPIVDSVYAKPDDYNSLSIVWTIIFYSFQIYSDFFGYSIIAIGSARLLGIDLMDNFKTPYLAKNISEFWKRWHISLSTWFRDYLFIPLGGSRVKISRFYFNIFVVFTVSGLWHGANWTFVIWGALHALYYLIENIAGKVYKIKDDNQWNFINIARVIYNFSIVTIAWVFFRSETFEKAMVIFKNIFSFSFDKNDISIPYTILTLLVIFVLSDLLLYKKRFDVWVSNKPAIIRYTCYFFLIYCITALGGVNKNPFIYFQF
jgi:D-alanyl-lipoteichoic acid acyltransferase DltB (MBOAT superfamily)